MLVEPVETVTVVVCAYIGPEIVGRWEISITVLSWAWTTQAPCRGLDPNMFVPEHDTATPPVVVLLCPTCPVRETCETFGRATRSTGWWGGVLLNLERPSQRTHCSQGHPFNEENTYLTADGRPKCRACNREKQVAFRQRQAQRRLNSSMLSSEARARV